MLICRINDIRKSPDLSSGLFAFFSVEMFNVKWYNYNINFAEIIMKIRMMTELDRNEVREMMRVFYASDAVHTNGSDEIFENDITNCVNNSPYLEGFVFEGVDRQICGYGMLAKSFSTEFGKNCIWIEDIYIKEQYRGMGIGTEFLSFVKSRYNTCVIRLEAEMENTRAVNTYEKNGFEILPYIEMIKL